MGLNFSSYIKFVLVLFIFYEYSVYWRLLTKDVAEANKIKHSIKYIMWTNICYREQSLTYLALTNSMNYDLRF